MCYGSSTSNMPEGDDSTDGMVDIIFIWPAPLIWSILSANPDHFPLIGCSKINSSLIRSCYHVPLHRHHDHGRHHIPLTKMVRKDWENRNSSHLQDVSDLNLKISWVYLYDVSKLKSNRPGNQLDSIVLGEQAHVMERSCGVAEGTLISWEGCWVQVHELTGRTQELRCLECSWGIGLD